jgi:hypothetical protein
VVVLRRGEWRMQSTVEAGEPDLASFTTDSQSRENTRPVMMRRLGSRESRENSKPSKVSKLFWERIACVRVQ